MPKVLLAAQTDIDATCEDVKNLTILLWFNADVKAISTLPLHRCNSDTPLHFSSSKKTEVLTKGCEYTVLSISSVVRIESVGKECTFYLDTGLFLTTTISIETLAEVLGDCSFIRTHPSHLINLAYLKTYVNCNAFVTLSNSDAVPVSHGNNQLIIDFLNSQTIL
jgi:two-component system LytT family response regulator